VCGVLNPSPPSTSNLNICPTILELTCTLLEFKYMLELPLFTCLVVLAKEQ
jgi:hypothetical protein